MPLYLNEDQTALEDSARDFMAAEAPIAALRRLRDEGDALGYAPALWRQFGDMGFTGVLVPEAQGGLGLGHVEAGIVMGQIGRNLTASPLLASGIVATSLIRAAGTPAQQAEWLPKLAAAQAIATLAIDETAKHKPWQGQTTARPDGDAWVLDGHKTFVLDGHVADLLLVVARTAGQAGERDGLSVFLLTPKMSGLDIERTVMADAHNAARLRLQGVRVPGSALLGSAPGQAGAALEQALNAGRVAAAAELLGLADETFARTVQYLKERQQFGQLIGEFQALQHRASHLHCELEITRAAVLHAQQLLDSGDTHAPQAAAVAKARAGRTATRAVQEGVQMHGGMGMTDAFDFGLFMKRARVLEELFGDANHHLDQFALARGY